MIMNYSTPPLEQKINELYKMHNITKPSHLSIEMLAEKFNIWLHYHNKRSKGIEVSSGMYSIFLDSRLPEDLRRLEFLHELCHLLRHAGNQTLMPEQFTRAQESEADRFVFYAAIPFFMIEKINLPSDKGEVIGFLSREFKVPLNFAKKRFQQIEDRIRQGEFLSAYELTAVSHEFIRDSTENYTAARINANRTEALIQAYYIWDGDCSRPEMLIIERPEGFDWDNLLEIEVDGNYESCDMPSYESQISATVLSGDLSIPNRKGYVTINLSRVAWRHGKSATQLYLPMDAIEDAVNF